MSYTDSYFFIFIVTVFTLYYLMRTVSLQIAVLLIASLFFYAWQSAPLLGVFLCAWFITSISSYAVATADTSIRAKVYATCGVLMNLGLLGFFKYKFLWIQDFGELASRSPQTLGEWLVLAPLPVGISFYSFHGISLMIDVYRKNYKLAFVRENEGIALKHLTRTLLYLVFFPQLIAGPIIKAKDFFPQVGLKYLKDIDFYGCFRILVLGYFLKSVIADSLGEQTAWMAYPYFQRKSSLELLLMLYGYSAQIFADFAGYSLIAIGLAKLFGYRLPDNFNFPYLSSSISEFWRRWHISLSSWLRDYLYIPLGGNKKGVLRTYLNLMIVMCLGGLWHGAAWSFALWGLWHGLGLALERPLLGAWFMSSNHLYIRCFRVFLVFNFVSFGWLFFKLQDASQAFGYLNSMLYNNASIGGLLGSLLICIYGAVIFAYHLLSIYRNHISIHNRNVLYGIMLFLIVTNSGSSAPFIYFQF
ncbi:MBOAT family O-acyltransferase [Methylomonas methanica]|uniref:Probable alginate O-acetylase n=1 Tax=Methylomonas methanica (strain DSM 25384 / MC09) TaxID=857087 RepID=F9ZWD3_METMM|nr:MBOAT family O-acyltransferase [Methylomonas methanica]AEF99602.1 membrane bound O-acyl transferase MBOAT family protein [Methylomonas methanica MC09]